MYFWAAKFHRPKLVAHFIKDLSNRYSQAVVIFQEPSIHHYVVFSYLSTSALSPYVLYLSQPPPAASPRPSYAYPIPTPVHQLSSQPVLSANHFRPCNTHRLLASLLVTSGPSQCLPPPRPRHRREENEMHCRCRVTHSV